MSTLSTSDHFHSRVAIIVVAAMLASLLHGVLPEHGAALEPLPDPLDLDASFADGGVAAVSHPGWRITASDDVIVQDDGRVVFAGTVRSTGQDGNEEDFLLSRFEVDGSPDRSFGPREDHHVRVSVGPYWSEMASATALPGGDIVAVGRADTGEGRWNTALARVDRDGHLVDGFGTGGRRVVDLAVDGDRNDGARSVIADPSGERIYVAGYADQGWRSDAYVARFDARTGALDPDFGQGGIVRLGAALERNTGFIANDLAYVQSRTEGELVVVVGHSSQAGEQFIAAITPGGTLASGWGAGSTGLDISAGTGITTTAYEGGDAHARSITVGSDGGLLVAGGRFPWGTGPHKATYTLYDGRGAPVAGDGGPDRFDDEGRLHGDYSSTDRSGGAANAGSVMTDEEGRFVGVGQEGRSIGLAALDQRGLVGEPRTLPCGQDLGGASAVAADAEGRYLVAGTCDDDGRIVRLVGTSDPDGGDPGDGEGYISSVELTVDRSTERAGRDRTPIGSLDALEALLGAEEGLQAAPLRNTPLRNTPLRNTPLRNTPLRNTPLRNTPLRNTPLAPILLSQIPLRNTPLRNTSWEEVLLGSRYDGVPLQTVTLDDVFELPDADGRLEGITLEMIDLSATPLRNTTITALLLGDVPLSALPAPDDGWCAFLSGGGDCPDGVEVGATTLLQLELAGFDLSAYYAQPLSIVGTDLAGSVLAGIRLRDVALEVTPFGPLPAAAVAPVMTCGDACAGTVAERLDDVREDATLGELLDLLPVTSGATELLADVSLGQVLVGLLPADALPFEDLPLDRILAAAPFRSTDLLTYTASFELPCGLIPALTGRFSFPYGFRVVPGSSSISHPDLDVTVSADSPTSSIYEVVISGSCAGTAPVEITVQAEPPAWVGGTAGASFEIFDADRTINAGDGTPGITVTDRDGPGSDERTITTDALYTGYVSDEDDVDLYEIPAPPAGSRLTVTLSNLPDDYDLVLYGPEGSDPLNAPLRNTPLRNTPLRNTPLRNTGLGDDAAEPGSDGRTNTPDGLQDVPLRNTPLRNTSINRGTENESVTTVVRGGDVGGSFLVQVSGYNGASSGDPYVLRAKVTPPPEPLDCITRPYGDSTPGSLPAAPSDPATIESLILVNEGRLAAVFGDDEADAVLEAIAALAEHERVNGLVLPVDGDAAVRAAYEAWDDTPCAVEAANTVVDTVNGVVDTYREGMSELRHLLIVGGDELIPHGRVPDLTSLGNEFDYLPDLRFQGLDNPLSSAARQAYLLSDDPYGDLDPQAWLNGRLFVPDVGLGRLVESPTEIVGAIERFLETDGILDPTTSFVTAYDFLSDGGEEVRDAVDPVGGPQHRIDEEWSAQDAIEGTDAAAAEGGFISVNAHYDHYRGLPADTHDGQAADLFYAGQLQQPLAGSLLFTMGCHAGLNVADVFVATPATPTVDDPANDWAQRTAELGGLFTGNTGYGYGDTVLVAYSELLMANYARNLASGAMSAGQALMFAKQQHVAELGIPGVYDAKAMEVSTYYGLPMYRIGEDGTLAPPALPRELPEEDPQTIDLRAEPFEAEEAPERVETERGDHWVVGDERPQVSHFRPIQPRTSLDVTPADGLPVRGALIEELVSIDVPDVDPVYATPTIDLSANEPEADIHGGIFPTRLQAVTSGPTPLGWRDRLVLMAGQFATDEEAGDGTGTQRLFTRMAGTVYRSDSTDFEPPPISTVDGVIQDELALFRVTTPAEDVVRGLVLYRPPGGSTWELVELAPTTDGTWAGTAPVGETERIPEFLVQLVDAAGNVSASINKSLGHEATDVTVEPEPGDIAITVEGSGADGYFTEDPLVSLATGDGAGDGEDVEPLSSGLASSAPTIEYRLDSGVWHTYTAPFHVTGDVDAIHRLEVRRAGDLRTVERLIPVDRTAPIITIAHPTAGQVFPHGATVSPVFTCADAVSGVATCQVASGVDTAAPGTGKVFRVTASDRAGRTSAAEVVYDVTGDEPAPYRFEGFERPVDDDKRNVVRAGQAAPIRFRLHDGETVVDDLGVVEVEHRGVSCSSEAGSNLVTETVASKSHDVLRWDDEEQRFVYIHKSDRSWQGECGAVVFTVTHPDGTRTEHAARFEYRR